MIGGTQEQVNKAGVVLKGLDSIGDMVGMLGAGPDKPAPFREAMWGWHCAKQWVTSIEKRMWVFGPMAAWQKIGGWHFCLDAENKIKPRKFIGPGCEKTSQLYQQCSIGIEFCYVGATPQDQWHALPLGTVLLLLHGATFCACHVGG